MCRPHNVRVRLRLLQVCVLAFLGACSLLPDSLPAETPSPETGSAQATLSGTPVTAEPAGTPVQAETPSPMPAGSPVTLRIWLPPQFSPDPNTPAGAILDSRLDEFVLLHPGLRITVRLKGETGAGGMVSSLDATRGVVPEALPDLVLIPRPEMERAAQAGLLTPFADPLDSDWYEFGRSLAMVDQEVYGLPLATDALVLLYRPEAILDPPKDWTTTLNTPASLLFAGGSQQAFFTIALYEAAGGRLLDEDGRPFIDAPTLAALLGFYASAETAGILPELAAGLLNETDVFQVFQAGQTDMAITWVSNLFLNPSDEVAAAGLPTVTSVPYTLVTGWLWALSNPDPGRSQLATELAAFLTAPDFLSAWTQAAGLLPARTSALAGWPDSPAASLASRIVLSAHPLPPLDVLEKTGPVLQQAVEAVLSGSQTPQEAAETAANRVNAP